MTRRAVLGGLGGVAVASLSGCVSGSGNDSAIRDGYADRLSYRPGDTATLYLNARRDGKQSLQLLSATGQAVGELTADIYGQSPQGISPWETGFGYQPSASLQLPAVASGIYTVDGVVRLILNTSFGSSADVVVLYPTNTEAAYNQNGGRNMYGGKSAPIVSFRRPIEAEVSRYTNAFVSWFSGLQHPYSLRWISDADLEDFGEISTAKLLIVIGHSEYWTRRAREHFDRFVLNGGNALVLSGNTMWWQVRYSDDQSQLVCYKDAPDPVADPLLRTINWNSESLDFPIVPSIGAEFPRGGYGQEKKDKGWNGFRILQHESPIFRGVKIQRGDILHMPSVEYDGAPLLNNPVTQGEPQLDLTALGAYRAELIGYDYGARGGADTVGTWLVYQRTSSSGIVINGASTNWCSATAFGGKSGAQVKQIILNMIEMLLGSGPVFTN